MGTIMIELPEAITLAKQAHKHLIGKEVASVYASNETHKFAFFTGNPSEYDARLRGRTITDVSSLGAIVEFSFGDTHLTLRDGAAPRYCALEADLPKKCQLLITFTDHTYLTSSVQMYGALTLDEYLKQDNFYYQVAKDRINPTTPEFTLEYFKEILKKEEKDISVKAFLATEQRFPGIGNGCLHDILFIAGLNPKRKIFSLSDAQIEMLYHSINDTLSEMIALGGRDTERNLFGIYGGYKTKISSKTYKNPCPKCGSSIIKKAYLGGSIYYCEQCQPE